MSEVWGAHGGRGRGKATPPPASLNGNTKGPHTSHQKRLPFIVVY